MATENSKWIMESSTKANSSKDTSMEKENLSIQTYSE